MANGNARVDRQLRERVRRATDKLGIELQARKQKSKVLAFILSNREMLHPFHSHILVGAETASTAHGYSMLFLRFNYSTSDSFRELHLPAILETSGQISGFILAGTNSPNLLELLSHRGFPFVVLGNNILGEWEPERYDVVWFDDIQGAFEMTKYLQTLGHRHVWYVGNRRLTWYARRYEGYRRAMEEADLPPRICDFDSANDAQLGYLAAKSILSRGEPISAIFAGGDQAAQGACKALRERGLAVPEDVSVAGFNDTEAVMCHPPLTTIQVFPDQVSKRMIELLVNRIGHPDAPPQRSVIPTQLIKRESCDRLLPSHPPTAEELRTDAPYREPE